MIQHNGYPSGQGYGHPRGDHIPPEPGYGPPWQAPPPYGPYQGQPGPYPPAQRPPDSGGQLVLSILWAMVPLLTCGIGTPFTMGHAAMRLKSAWLGLATALYAIGILSFWVVISAYEDTDSIPGALDALIAVGFFGSTLGGVVHSFLIRSRVFPRAPLIYQPPPPPPLHVSQLPTQSSPHGQPWHAPGQTAGPQGQQNPYSEADTRVAGSRAKPLRPGDLTQIGPYRLLGILGKGGQGAVYLGLTPDGTKVAIKVLHDWFAGDEAAKNRFLREVEATRRVAQFSTARVLDVRVDQELAYIVSEFVDGSSLEQLVRRHGPRDGDALTRLALSTAGALAAIHRAGIVHRDFKPANVLIGPDGPRVIDFGIARALDQTNATSGKIIGTPAYMSPEQFTSGQVGPASDVFSWAATMIFAASGRAAFGEDTIPAIVNRVLNHHPDLSCLPPAMQPLAAACLDKNPDNRPTASEVMLRIVH